LYARAATLEEEERKAEEARLAEIARQAKLEEQRRQEEEAKAQAAAEAARQAERLEAERLEAERQEAERQESEAQAARDAAAQEEAARQEAERQAAEAQAEAERQAAEAARAEEERRAAEEQAQAETTPDESVEVVPAQEPEPVDTSNAADWISCVASAYTIADNDPPGSTATASGIPLDDSVPTVAMPMSMNPARFYGSMIQIEYGGLTVVATVTDCGYLSGGARGLDITPAVFRAFGFSSADDWGLSEVRYRFL
jgi:3D (Asp-Asp-Asp) domain-containing protein